MRHTTLSLPELGLIAGTRGALGAGIALLLGERMTLEQRRAVGWTLFAVGAITTLPLSALVFGRHESPSGKAADTAQPRAAKEHKGHNGRSRVAAH